MGKNINLCVSSQFVLLFSEVGCPGLYFLFESKLNHICWNSISVAHFSMLSRFVQRELNGQIVSTEGVSWDCLEHTGHPGVAEREGSFFFFFWIFSYTERSNSSVNCVAFCSFFFDLKWVFWSPGAKLSINICATWPAKISYLNIFILKISTQSTNHESYLTVS